MLSRKEKRRLQSSSASPLDLRLLFSVIALVVFGLIMVYDSSVVQAYRDYGDKYYYIRQQLVWVLLGLLSLVFFSRLHYRYLRKLALPLFVFSLVLLLAVFMPGLGIMAGGAHRWLKLGAVSIQPAEIIKLSSIIFFAALLEKRIRLLPFSTVVVSVCLIVGLFQKDLGSAAVYFLTSLIMLVLAGVPLGYLAGLVPVSIVGFLLFVFSSDYRKHRVLAFLDPYSDRLGYSYHIYQVLLALGSGGIFGLGLGQSRQKYEYIPEVTTDSIFAIVGEEFGMIGAVLLITLLFYLVFRGFKIAESCQDDFGKLLAAGLSGWLGIQAVINLGSMVALFPLTGVPLPFISYGGSALLVNLVAVGILLNISKSGKSVS